MSTEFDGPADVWEERWQTARKPHRCGACYETIRVGDRYCYTAILFDGRWDPVKRCVRCDRIYRHLLDVHPALADDGVDPALLCGHTYEEIHRRAPPPEIAALAFWRPEDDAT